MKVSSEQTKKGRTLADKHGFKKIYVNEKGEFFSNVSNAANSVGGDKDKYADISLGASTAEKTTNDQETAKEVVEHIEAAETVEAVTAILEAEKAGKNRKTVTEAAEKKIESLTAKGAE